MPQGGGGRTMRMIGNALLNFLKCLIYIFVPLGCIFLGFLFGAQLFLRTLSEQADYVVSALASLASQTEITLRGLADYLYAAVRGLDWGDPFTAVRTLLDGKWLAATLTDFLQLTAAEAAQLGSEIDAVAANVVGAVGGAVWALVGCTAAGLIAGYFITNYFVRKSTVRRGFWGFWVAAAADAVLTATLIAFVTWLLTVSKAGAAASAVVGGLLFGCVALIEAYLLHGRGKVAFRTVVNGKNCVFVCLSQLAVLAAAAAVGALLAFLTGALVAAALVAAVVVIALLVISVNTESYVDRLAKGAAQQGVSHE